MMELHDGDWGIALRGDGWLLRVSKHFWKNFATVGPLLSGVEEVSMKARSIKKLTERRSRVDLR